MTTQFQKQRLAALIRDLGPGTPAFVERMQALELMRRFQKMTDDQRKALLALARGFTDD